MVAGGDGVPRWLSGKESACQSRRLGRHGFHPWVRKTSWRKGMVARSSILAWEIPWTEEPGRLQSMRPQRAGHDWELRTHKCTLPKPRNTFCLSSWCSLCCWWNYSLPPFLLLSSARGSMAPLYAGSLQHGLLCSVCLLLSLLHNPLPWRVGMWPRWANHNTKSLCPHWLVQRWVTCPKSGQSEFFPGIC